MEQKAMKKSINVFGIILAVGLILYSLAMIILFAWGFMNTFKTSLGFDISCLNFPTGERFTLTNWVNAFEAIKIKATINGKEYYINFIEMFFNSLVYAVGCAFCGTFVPCLVAYVTTKYKFAFNGVVYGIVLFAMITPIVGSTPSSMEMMKGLGLYDTQLGLWFMSANFLGTYFLIFQATFKGLSWEYAEAAFMDGASHVQVLFKVMLPLVANTFSVIFLLNFIMRWNDYQTPWLYLPNVPVAAVGVQFFNQGGEGKYAGSIPIRLTANMLLMLPCIVLFCAFRDKLIGSLTVGGIKG